MAVATLKENPSGEGLLNGFCVGEQNLLQPIGTARLPRRVLVQLDRGRMAVVTLTGNLLQDGPLDGFRVRE